MEELANGGGKSYKTSQEFYDGLNILFHSSSCDINLFRSISRY